MRTLVFGGTFDPCHLGHASLLRAAAETIRPDKILIVPAYRSPLKKHEATATPADRLIMARLGILNSLPLKWRRRCRLDAREARARRPVFTIETLSALKEESSDLYFVCGQDAAASFPRWRDPARLKSSATWWYGARPGSSSKVPSHFRKLPGKFPDISSTELRSALALGRDCSKELSPSVMSYIERRGLYGRGLLSVLEASLSSHRYEHTLNVASLAESLARRHGADPDKARLAGLLHDLGRRYPPPALAAYARRRRLRIPGMADILASDPMLLHAYVSEDVARRELGVSDPEVLGAIRRHTLGDPRMGLLDRVLYVADAASLDRTYPGAAAVRALAFEDLDAALLTCVRAKLVHAVSREAWLHPLTVELWNRLAAR